MSWDRVHNTLNALPGTARLAVVNGGTIPDTGQYPVYLGEDGPRLGELDEEFVLERRVGETFVLGTATWRIDAIEAQRVTVSRAEGRSAVMPFWRGEDSPRTPELGEAVGALCREVAAGLGEPGHLDRLATEFRLEPNAARVLSNHVARQLKVAGAVPDDRTVLVESFLDPAGERGLAVLTPFGGKLHQALKLVIQARLKQRLGIDPACLHGDDGLLFRLPQTDEPPFDLFAGLTSELAESLIRSELGDSALFGLRFRQNAGRALLMPRPDPSKRTPLWLQRLRAKDLLQVVRRFPDFPVVVETYRECLDDDLDLPRLRAFLDAVGSGAIRVVARRGDTPSPFVSDLIFRFQLHYMYQWDEPRSVGRPAERPSVDEDLLDPLLDPSVNSLWLDPSAVGRVESRLRGLGKPLRSLEEMAETSRRLGDLAPSDLAGPMLAFLTELEQAGRVTSIVLDGTREPQRRVSREEEGLYEAAFGARAVGGPDEVGPALETIVRRFLMTHALVGLEDLTARYPIGPVVATELLEKWSDAGALVRLEPIDGEDQPRWADGRNLEEVRRLSIAIRRKESIAVAPEVFADFLLRRQNVHPETRREGAAAVSLVLEQLQGYAAHSLLWESELLPARVSDYRPSWLDEALGSGAWLWRARGEPKGDLKVAFVARSFLEPLSDFTTPPTALTTEAEDVESALARLGASFTTDLARATGLAPSRVRSGLHELLSAGLVTNDRFDPLRPGNREAAETLAAASAPPSRRRQVGRVGRSGVRSDLTRPEGRWSRLPAGPPGETTVTTVDAWSAVLLDRYGVLTRETVALDAWAPPWRDLQPHLARAELRGEVRRGYFVEGLSGVQYATAEAADALARMADAPAGGSAPVLVSAVDPANLYGSGAPLDIDLLEGGTARLPRSGSNHLVLCGGRPVLIIEGQGKRLTGLASASEAELRAATALLTRLARPPRRALKVETYNGVAVISSALAPWLAEAGFVRDYPAMTYYAGW